MPGETDDDRNEKWAVLDASFLVRLVTGVPGDVFSSRLAFLQAETYTFAGPTLVGYEVTNALWKLERFKVMNRELSTLAFEQFRALPLQQFMSSGIHGRALDLTRSLNLGRAYDAHYVALAELLDAELITADSKLANAFARTYSRIQLLGSSSN